jgi:hypothetical protein
MRFPIFHSLLFVLCLNASLLVAQETPLAPKVDKPLMLVLQPHLILGTSYDVQFTLPRASCLQQNNSIRGRVAG